MDSSLKTQYLAQSAGKGCCEIGLLSKQGKPVADARKRKSGTACGKIGCQEIVQQLVAQIPQGCFFHLLNNKPVGLSGYVASLTESLLPVRHADRSEKAQGVIAQSRRDRS